MSEAFRLLGEPRFGGILAISDHASNHVPEGIALGVAAERMYEHVALDIGVAEVGALMAMRPGVAAFHCAFSRLVCDVNRDEHAPGTVPETSDGIPVPGNVLSPAARAARIARFHAPYHDALADQLDRVPQSLILSLHSFTPALATCDKPRPWHVGVLYNEDDRAARLAIPLLEDEGLRVGDQQPYSGRDLNYTMNRHAEAEGRPYLGVEIRQSQIADPAGQARWAGILLRVCNKVALDLGG